MPAVAERRGLDLGGYLGGVAMMRAGDIGREVWVSLISPSPRPSPRGRGGPEGEEIRWIGPFLVVDCAQRAHYAGLVERGRVIELGGRAWARLGWPRRPVGVVVSFEGPEGGPAVRWM